MLAELNGKAGCLCEPARQGLLRCPLIVRPISEDVVTANIFGTLKIINPRWWLPDLLNRALGAERFRRQIYRKLTIETWRKQRPYPREFLPWVEGATEVDVLITWENPPTTIFIEMKYASGLGLTTANNDGTGQFPADQLIRNARVGLRETGWFDDALLFDMPRRDFVVILFTPARGNPLVKKYQDPVALRTAIPHGDKLSNLPRLPFVGELGYQDLITVLSENRRWLGPPEARAVDQLADYLQFKLQQLPSFNGQGYA